MPRVLILSWHFYPSREVGAKRISELARRLRDSGWEVSVMTAPHDTVHELANRIEGMEVTTISPPTKIYPRLAALWRRGRSDRAGDTAAESPPSEPDSPRRFSLRRPLQWLRRHYNALEWLIDDKKLWSLRVLMRALGVRRRWDWIISSGPPISIHLAARALATVRRTRWLMDLRDPWIGNGIWPEHIKSRLRDRIELRAERSCLRRADWITVASPGIARGIASRLPAVAQKVQVVLNGYDGRPLPATGARGELRLLYAGTLYLNRNPFPLLEALQQLADEPGIDRTRLHFTLVGNCSHWQGHEIGAWVKAHGMESCVKVLPAVSPAEVTEMMRDSEVLVNFAQGQPDQIPAKLYDYIASGREMLLIAEQNSDAAKVTRESGAGRIVEPNDDDALRDTLRALYEFYVIRRGSFAPPQEAIDRFSRARQNSSFLGLLSAAPAKG